METPYTFFIGGKFYNILKEEGETGTKFNMRVKFILTGLQKMSFIELYKYSKMYANMVLFGCQPLPEQRDNIRWLLGLEEEKPEEPIEVNEVALEDAKFALTSETILSVDQSQIVTINGATITPLGDHSFIQIPENDVEPLLGQTVHNVTLNTSSDNGKTAGLVLEIASENDDEVEIIELKTCADPKCDEPAPVLITNPDVNIGVVVNPITIEVIPSSEDDEIFGDPTARNAFLMPDMKCYTFNAGDDPEETMEKCVMERLSKQPDLIMKLRSTKQRNLVFKPIDTDPNLHYWTEENRYGLILMKIRDSLKPTRSSENVSTVENLEKVVNTFFEIPIDNETMDAYRKQVLKTTDMENGLITDYTSNTIMSIFKAYDLEMFGGNMEGLINAGTISVVFGWKEGDTEFPCGLDVQDNGVFTLEPSKKLLEGLKIDGSKHNIFGVICETPAACLLVFIESFIATIVYETLKLEKPCEVVAESIFGHFTPDIKFAPKKLEQQAMPQLSMRDRLRAVQATNPDADIIITIKDVGRVILMSAQSKDALMIKSIPGEGNVVVQFEQRSQSYENVTHIQDVAI